MKKEGGEVEVLPVFDKRIPLSYLSLYLWSRDSVYSVKALPCSRIN